LVRRCSARTISSRKRSSFGLGAGVKYFRWETVAIRAHFRYKPTLLSDEDAANFCDPFGFCQGTLQQVELRAGR
jgi:hypothetical protein